MLKICVSLCFVITIVPFASFAKTPPTSVVSEQMLDAVVATVDETPITLVELQKRLSPPRVLTLEQAANDSEARTALDRMIFELIIKIEADQRKISVNNADVDRYIDEVMQRNSFTKEGLEAELKKTGKTLAQYRTQVTTDILQARLSNAMIQNTSAVTQDEVDAYLSDHPELMQSGARVKLRRIFISTATRSDAEAKTLADDLHDKAQDDHESFAELATKSSEGPEAKDGGSLGELSEKDLSPDIFAAVMRLDKGGISDVAATNNGYQFFYLEQRLGTSDQDKEAIVAEIKKNLGQQKINSKMETYFGSEMYKVHTIDKKI